MAADGRLNAAIIELTGGEVDSQIRELARFEANAAGSIAAQTGAATGAGGHPACGWTSQAFLAAGCGPGAVCDPVLKSEDTAAGCWRPDADGDEAASIAIRLRRFAMTQFALVERAIHGRLLAMWEGIAEPDRAELRWHFICTIRRDAAPEYGQSPIHADTFDGCMVAFALTCNKIQTPIFPAAHFDPPAVEQFAAAAAGRDDGSCRPHQIRLAQAADGSLRTGPPRRARDAVLLVLPGAVAHSIPSGVRLHDEESTDSRGEPLAARADNRWFCRVSVEIVAGGVSQAGAVDGGAWQQWKRPWPAPLPGQRPLREQVCLLTAAHVWGDPGFAALAAARSM